MLIIRVTLIDAAVSNRFLIVEEFKPTLTPGKTILTVIVEWEQSHSPLTVIYIVLYFQITLSTSVEM